MSASPAPTDSGNATRNENAFEAVPGSVTQRPYLALLAFLLGGAGCSTLQQSQGTGPQTAAVALSDCRQWFHALDDAVAKAGVADVAARRITGFSYLRVDRFSAAFGEAAGDDTQLREAWVARMRTLDAQGRRVEIANLPDDVVDQLGAGPREDLIARADECARYMTKADLPAEAAMALLRKRARVPDDYSAFKRAIGLYGLTAVPFSAGIDDWQGKTEQAFRAARQGQTASYAVVRYVPPADPVMTRAQVSELLVAAAAEPLGIARLSEEQRERLFATYAPVLEIETAREYDRIGRLYWSSELALRVDVSAPTVYRNLAYTRVGNRTLVQLIYTVWMPERPSESRYDMLAGHLDGIVWRVTLAPDGEPVLFDSIHPCGCYHMFFPTPRAVAVPSPEPYIEWAFSPAPLPTVAEPDRLVISAQTRTHYLTNVWPASAAGGVSYAFADYDELRTLPLPSGGSRSAFGPDGLIAGTERGERFLFWPMGIASPGAMRQWGSQPTAFVGRRHFDDADLIERRFRLLP